MDYYQGYDDGMYQAQGRNMGLVGFLFRISLSLVWGVFVYVPLLIVGYWLATKVSHLHNDEMFIKIPLTLVFAYLGFGFIYFLKGMVISLRASKKSWWILIWTVCVITTCGFQFFFVQFNLEEFLSNRNVANYTMWSWLVATFVGILIYGHYKFLTNIAPGSVFPFFSAGFKLASKPLSTSAEELPTKSIAYFENSGMAVSYRKK